LRRTAFINQIRGLLLQRGITLRKGRHHVDVALPLILEDADVRLSGAVRMLLAQLKLDLVSRAPSEPGIAHAPLPCGLSRAQGVSPLPGGPQRPAPLAQLNPLQFR
jgi:hypothetical protein